MRRERNYRGLANFEVALIEVLEDISEGIDDLVVEVRELRAIFKPKAQSATLTIIGENMATILVGKTAQALWQEFSGPNGTGDKLPTAGAVTYTSSDPSVATVDPSSGMITAVALGTATIAGVDAANSLAASDSATTSEVAQSATLTVVPN